MTSRSTDATLVETIVSSASVAQANQLIDIGVNLADKAYDKDRADVIERAKRAGLVALVITGCDLHTSAKAQSIAATRGGLYFTAGIHPHNAKDCNQSTIDELAELAQDPLCVAIGECGLDFNRNFSPPEVQEEWFDKQVGLACKLQKPLFLHCRDAEKRFADVLRRHKLTAPAVAHCFTGNKQELEELLSLGLHIGITGWVCDERPERGGSELAELLHLIPTGKLMVETDGPYLTPRNIIPNKSRPRRNEPALLSFVLQKVAKELALPEAQIAQQTTETAKKFFYLKAFL